MRLAVDDVEIADDDETEDDGEERGSSSLEVRCGSGWPWTDDEAEEEGGLTAEQEQKSPAGEE